MNVGFSGTIKDNDISSTNLIITLRIPAFANNNTHKHFFHVFLKMLYQHNFCRVLFDCNR